MREPTIAPLSKAFVQPEGFPDTATVNSRVSAAVARLNVCGEVPQPNPFVTAWQLHALIKVLTRKGLLSQTDLDEVTYFTAWHQMNDLERIVDRKPQHPLIVPAPRATNGG